MTDITCAACGSAQPAGAALCALCGAEFPRTGQPVPQDARRPAGGIFAHDVPEAGLGLAAGAPASPDTVAAGIPAAPAGGAGPDGVPAGATIAGTGRRFAAWLLDGVATGVLPFLTILVGLGMSGVPLNGGVVEVTQEEAAAIFARVVGTYVVAALVALACWVALVIVEGRTGRTVGGALLGLRTVDAGSYRPVGFWRAALRWIIIGAGTIVLGIGQFVVLASPSFDGPRRQGWHDKAARTVVLHRARDAGPEPITSLAAFTAPAPTPAAAAAAPQAPVAAQAPVPAQAPVAAAAPAPREPVAPATPDPWEFPASQAPGEGLITRVPGVVKGGPTAEPAAPATAPPGPALAAAAPADRPAAEPAAHPAGDPSDDGPVDGQTRMVPVAPRPAALVLETGERVAVVTTQTLVGRNPQAPAGETWATVVVPDGTRSVSKTHAELYPDPSGLWVVDRGSTNGTVVSAPGQRPRIVAAGARVRVPFDATLHLGDCPVKVVRGDA
ncbi:RDD family protein [Isoptericola sp. NPDC019482]|uniref:RDD family protein n=1 Tax=Isoptericola sp. NPDC019482 TaxID=3154688 RepID=UPI0034866FAE